MRWVDVDGTKVVALTDATPAPSPCRHSFPDADLASRPDLAARWLADGMFRTRFGLFLLRRDDGDILLDCGMGPGPVDYFPGMRGNLPEALLQAGSALDQISKVIFTHLHLDHAGWSPHLPNAAFWVAESEWAHWSRGADAGLPHHVAAWPIVWRLWLVPAGCIWRLPGQRSRQGLCCSVHRATRRGITPFWSKSGC